MAGAQEVIALFPWGAFHGSAVWMAEDSVHRARTQPHVIGVEPLAHRLSSVSSILCWAVPARLQVATRPAARARSEHPSLRVDQTFRTHGRKGAQQVCQESALSAEPETPPHTRKNGCPDSTTGNHNRVANCYLLFGGQGI